MEHQGQTQAARHHAGQAQHHASEGIKSLLPDHGPSGSQVLVAATLLPAGGTLLVLSGLTLIGTLISLAVTFPLFVIFSPVLVPAAIAIGLAVTGFLTAGGFGLTALTSLSWIANYVQSARQKVPEQIDYAKRRMGETVQMVGQRTKDAGQQLKEARLASS